MANGNGGKYIEGGQAKATVTRAGGRTRVGDGWGSGSGRLRGARDYYRCVGGLR